MVWLVDQNALRGQYKLGKVVSVKPDCRGIVRDLNVRTFTIYPVPVKKKDTAQAKERRKKQSSTIPFLQRDVGLLVVPFPIEDELEEGLKKTWCDLLEFIKQELKWEVLNYALYSVRVRNIF